MDMRIFHTMQLVEMYNERAEVLRFDGGVDGLFKYQRAIAGDQANNEGMFLPLEVVKQVALQPWQVARELMRATA